MAPIQESHLWTPDGDRPISRQRGVDNTTPEKMRRIREMHDVAQDLGIELRCTRCGTPFQGFNDGFARGQAVFCKCREIRAEVGGRLVQSALR